MDVGPFQSAIGSDLVTDRSICAAPPEWSLCLLGRTNTYEVMKNSIITALAIFLSSVAVQAQEKTTTLSSNTDPREQCLMATGADWARLGIDQEQILSVNAIQSTCMQDCVAARDAGSGITSVVDRHIAELRKVLTPEQFDSWDRWCSDKLSTRTEPSKQVQ